MTRRPVYEHKITFELQAAVGYQDPCKTKHFNSVVVVLGTAHWAGKRKGSALRRLCPPKQQPWLSGHGQRFKQKVSDKKNSGEKETQVNRDDDKGCGLNELTVAQLTHTLEWYLLTLSNNFQSLFMLCFLTLLSHLRTCLILGEQLTLKPPS